MEARQRDPARGRGVSLVFRERGGLQRGPSRWITFQGTLKAPDFPLEPAARPPRGENRRAESAELSVAETVGRLMQFWGFKRPMGRLWTVLYLSPTPLGAAELAERLDMSTGGVSMALGELERWGAVVRTSQAGTRRDYFQAEPDIWKLARRVLRERELGLVQEFRETLQRAEAELSSPRPAAPPSARRAAATPNEGNFGLTTRPQTSRDHDDDLEYKRDRLRTLAELARTGELLLGALCAGRPVDPSALLTDEPST